MREVIFRKQNKEKWSKIEDIFAHQKESTPDQLANAYVEVMNDLSYAKTYYPGSKSLEYLNNFATKLHHVIYVNKKEEAGRFVQFWKYEVPLVVRKHHKMFLFSLFCFLIFVLIGVVSQYYNKNFARTILGDYYVEMTLQNIEDGDPMGVYKDANQFQMFFRILVNNLLVSLRLIAAGIVPFIGPIYFLMHNGIMVGTFLYFFVQEGLWWESFRTVFIHGTVELISIVIAGAASFIISSSLLFPGTYSRIHSLIQGVQDAVKIAAGLIPFIIFAAFMEGYVTRYTNMPDWLSILIIGLSLGLMVFYYVIYPIQLEKKLNKIDDSPILEVRDI